jgi:lysophospholipase L1-like esterase
LIHEGIQFHNVGELRDVPGEIGLRLQRVPEAVRSELNEAARMRMLQPDTCEIRFVSDGPCRVTLSSQGETRLSVFHGLFDGRQRAIIGREAQTVEIGFPERLMDLGPTYTWDMAFSPRVCRLIFGGPEREPVFFHRIQGDNIRAPEPVDLPDLRYLAYGTSITHGFDAEGPHLSYVSQTARHLGADLINLGVGGSAYCEHQLSDYIGARDDWDIASLALSVNMQGFPLDEFYERVSYMVNTVSGGDPNRPVACITLYPHFRDFGIDPADMDYGGTSEQYRQALRDAVSACPNANVHLIEGTEILTDIAGLTADLIHPGDNGMIEMGRNLARKLQELLPKQDGAPPA